MPTYYIDPHGNKYTSPPQVVQLKSGKTLSIPKSITELQWKKIPGCKVEEYVPYDNTQEYIQSEIERLKLLYPYESSEKPGIVVDAKTIMSFIVKAIQSGAPLPHDRVPTFRELYNARDFFEPTESTAMLTLYQGITMQCGGAEKTYMLLGHLAMQP